VYRYSRKTVRKPAVNVRSVPDGLHTDRIPPPGEDLMYGVP